MADARVEARATYPGGLFGTRTTRVVIQTAGVIRLFVGAGRQAGVRPGDLGGGNHRRGRHRLAFTAAQSRSPIGFPWSKCRKVLRIKSLPPCGRATIRGKSVQFRREKTG
jgi:hypothetical protein